MYIFISSNFIEFKAGSSFHDIFSERILCTCTPSHKSGYYFIVLRCRAFIIYFAVLVVQNLKYSATGSKSRDGCKITTYHIVPCVLLQQSSPTPTSHFQHISWGERTIFLSYLGTHITHSCSSLSLSSPHLL
jgi:hypothetical protein